MPRIEFDTLEEAKDWIKDKVIESKKNYEGYFTKKKELVLIPNKSTRPIVCGYINFAKKEDVRKLFPAKFKIYACKNYEWDSQHTISRRE